MSLLARLGGESIGDLPDNVIEALKGIGRFDRDASYEGLPELDRNKDAFTVITQGGDEHVTHEGLIDMAHRDGLMLTYTEPIIVPKDPSSGDLAMFRAVVVTSRGVFTGYGDANADDTMVDAVVRQAETRALNRALRDAVNIGSATAEEIPADAGGVVVE